MATKKKIVKKKIVKTEPKPSLLDKYKALFARDKFLWFLLTTGIVLIVGGAIFGGIVAYEKWQFNKAEKALDSLYADIVAELGQPINVEKDKSCGYSSAKFNKGELSCRVMIKLEYPLQDINELNSTVYSIISEYSGVKSLELPYSYFNEPPFSISFTINNVNIRCGAQTDLIKNNSELLFSCSDGSIIEHFPVRD